jgi:hypothetical protein
LSWKNLGKTQKKSCCRCRKIVMLEEGDQNEIIVKKVVKGYGDLASVQ